MTVGVEYEAREFEWFTFKWAQVFVELMCPKYLLKSLFLLWRHF